MRIARIEKVRSRIPRYRLVFEEGEPVVVSAEIIGRFVLGTGDELTERKVSEISLAQQQFDAKRIAVNYVSYRPRSEKEVATHLERKGFSPEVAKEAASHLQHLGFVNDEKFARMFVKDRLQRRAVGLMILRHKLIEKGVARGVIDVVLHDLATDEVQLKAAIELLRSRMRRQASSLKRFTPAQRQKRMFDFLMRKGFSAELVKKALAQIGIGGNRQDAKRKNEYTE